MVAAVSPFSFSRRASVARSALSRPAALPVSGGAALVEVAVRGGAGDAQHFGDVNGGDALVPELPRLGGVGVIELAKLWPMASKTYRDAIRTG